MNVSRPYQVTQDQVARSSTLDPGDIGRWAININGSVQLFDNHIRASLAYHSATGRGREYVSGGGFEAELGDLTRQVLDPFRRHGDKQLDDEQLLELAYLFDPPGVGSIGGRIAELKLARILRELEGKNPDGDFAWDEFIEAVLITLGMVHRININLIRAMRELGEDPAGYMPRYWKDWGEEGNE